MTDYGATLNAQAGAKHERAWSKSEEIDQLIDVFLESGLTIGSDWYKADDADEYFYNSREYEAWLSMAKKSSESERPSLMKAYEGLKQIMLRRYVEELDAKLTAHLEDIAS